jgi:ATP-dependent Clp protease ATP-binding subunit ClpB
VVLFDEIEKAHPDVFNVLLQLLDDGRLTDSQGRTVDFKNTVVIMTSNIGSTTLIEAGEAGPLAFEGAAEQVRLQLRDHFRPEFLNRVDETIVFRPLDESQLRQIAGLLVAGVERRLAESDIRLELTEAALTLLAREGYDPVYGARPLRRAIQRYLENPLARRILGGEVAAGGTIRVDANAEGELTFNGSAEPSPGSAPQVMSTPGGSTAIN